MHGRTLNRRFARVMRTGPLAGDTPPAGGGGGGNGTGQGGGQGGQGAGANGAAAGAGSQGAAQNGAQNGGGNAGGSGTDPGYPANTPVAEMTTEQQLAYWKFHSRKHEGRLQGLGLTPGQEADELKSLREAQAKLKQIEDSQLSDVERLTKERDELAVRNQELTIAKVRTDAAAAAQLPADMAEFITAVTPEQAQEQAEKLAARLGTSGGNGSGSAGGGTHDQGHRGGGTQKAGMAAGRDRYAERHKNKAGSATT